MGIGGALIRWVAVLVIGLVSFWPDWGVLWLSIRFFQQAPFGILICDCLWAILLALALPLTLHWFRVSSTAALLGLCAVSGWWAYSVNVSWIGAIPWFIWMVTVVFFAFGWWKVATPLWRWANGIVAVQQAGTEAHHDGGHQ